ncbi:MAG: AMP-binding protein [Steroidobacteraceae bacterium]|nr:AMP-binding protein [Steroidobacteraceae bacterium]MBP7015247.1 AMP-binding protein [Steroidobacteraceae bacterium]
MTLPAATPAGANTRGPVLEKIWLQHYPAGVPAEINPSGYRSLRELIEQAIAAHRDRPCFTCMDRTLTYGDLDVLANRFAAYLQQVARLRKGDRIALMLPNVLQYPVAILGAFRAGLTIVNTNPMYTPRELQHQLHDSGARAILILENFAHTLAEVQHEVRLDTVIVTGVGDLLAFPKSLLVNFALRHVKKQVPEYSLPGTVSLIEALSKGRYENLERVELGHEDIAFLQYTGGTTGVSKGAVLTHRNLIANVLQSEAWIRAELKPDEPLIAITALPLYHIFALTANSLTMIKLGAHNILIPNPRDFAAFVKELAQYRFSFFAGVNTLFNALLHTRGFDNLDFSGLRVSLGGGMAVQQAVAERWKAVTGNVLTQAWGLTETSPAACINRPGDDFNGSIGLPISSTIVTIRDDDGNVLPQGQSGEICVAGPQVMRCYWNRPDETDKVMLPGQVLRTGDIGYMDANGFVYIEDRKKDMILVSGFNVYPNEVEGVAVTCPGVLEVAAVAQPDERAGEVVALFVVRKDPALTEEALIEHCRRELTGYKVPKRVYFRDELPKTNVGKILRRELKDSLQPQPAKPLAAAPVVAPHGH